MKKDVLLEELKYANDLPPENKNSFGYRLRCARIARGFTQGDVAQMLGLQSPQAYSRYERMDHAPKGETVRKLAGVLRISVEDLVPELPSYEPALLRIHSWIKESEGIDIYRYYSNEAGRTAAAWYLMEGLNEAGQRAALDMIQIISKVPEYKKETQ